LEVARLVWMGDFQIVVGELAKKLLIRHS